MKVCIVGGGVMGEAILGAALDRGVFRATDVTVVEKLSERRGYLAGDWARMLNLRVALEVALLVALCSLFVAYTTYALVWKALRQMFGPKPGA